MSVPGAVDGAGGRLRRSALICPGDDPSLMGKMAASRADVRIVDWEDGVLPSRKALARELTAEAMRKSWTACERVVRINGVDTPYAVEDLIAAAGAGCDAVMLPMVRSADDVEKAAFVISHAELKHGIEPGSLRLWTMIETVHSVLDLDRIARATRMTAMMFGGGDLGADLKLKRIELGADRTLGMMRYEYLYAMGRFVAAARAAGIDPLNTGYSNYRDLDGTREDAKISAQFGFAGALAISPRQVDTLNEVFGPTTADIEWADKVLAAQDRAGSQEKAVEVVDGGMVDGPFYRKAVQIRELGDLIAARTT